MRKRSEILQSQMMEIMRRSSAPLSAYDLLGELQKTNHKTAPPTVYRALSALSEQGRVHRVESLNAYVLCNCTSHSQPAIMSICDDCGTVQEQISPDLVSELSSLTGQNGFTPKRHVIEVHGTCNACDPTEARL